MPEPSTIAKRIPVSDIRKFIPFADMAKRKGIRVYHLNIGQPDLKTPEKFKKAMKDYNYRENIMECFPEGVLAYAKSGGMDSYREALVDYYNRHNINVSKENIIVTTAGSEALQFAFTTVCDPGDKIIVPEPFFLAYTIHAKRAGIELLPFTTDIRKNFALEGFREGLESILKKNNNIKGILINSPNNPTGVVYCLEEMEAVVDVAKKHDLFVISDEVYREFCFDAKEHISIMHFDKMSDNAIIVDSMSKRYSLCGARMGTIVSKNMDVMNAAMKMAQGRLSAATLEQIGCEAVLEDLVYVEKAKEEYEKRRDIAYEVLSKGEDIITARPSGAFYMIMDLGKGLNNEILDAEEFVWYMLEKFNKDGKTTMVTPAQGFYITPDIGSNQVRLAFVIGAEKLRDACEILLEGLYSFKERKQHNAENGYIAACEARGILR